MKQKPARPIRLKQFETKHRILLWASIGLAVGIVLLGWFFTIRHVMQTDMVQLRAQVDSSLDKAADTFGDFSASATGSMKNEVEKFQDNLEIFYQTVDEVKREQGAEHNEAEQGSDAVREVSEPENNL